MDGRPNVGICLDPGNTVSILEHPDAVIDLAAPHAVNVHVKDFAFSRAEDGSASRSRERLWATDCCRSTTCSRATPGINRIVEHWLPWQGDAATTSALERDWTSHSIEVLRRTTSMTDSNTLTIALIGAGGKMGFRTGDNLAKTDHTVLWVENSPGGQERLAAADARSLTGAEAAAQADVIILAVPDLALGPVSHELVPQAKSGAIVLTLDPAAAYAGLLAKRDDIVYASAHPCHPSIFLQRKTPEEWADTFGGIAAPQDAIASVESRRQAGPAAVEAVVRAIYAPVIDVHLVTLKQLAQLEPTLVETVACMVGALLNEALAEAVKIGIPEAAARSILLGHTQVALANGLRGDNPFSDACLIAMDYGRETIVSDDWKKIFQDDELDLVLARMLHLDKIDR